MTGGRSQALGVLLVLFVAATLRFTDLARRPLHPDEAVHAVKLGRLLESGRYVYDPTEFHGPTLNALTVPVALGRGQRDLVSLDEWTCRLVPAAAGLVVVLLPWLWWPVLPAGTLLLASALLAVSPAMVFYSRMYIQEMLLVCFSGMCLGGVVRFGVTGRRRWLLAAGLCGGLMHATKETCVFVWAAGLLAWGTVWWVERPAWRPHWRRAGLAGVVLGLVASALLVGWFGTNWAGVWDSWRTYGLYWHRARHGGHLHPWTYYVDLLTWTEEGQLAWNEEFVLVLGGVGLLMALGKRHWPGHRLCWLRWLALTTFFLWAIYTVIPYKTPWLILGPWFGTAMLAATAMAHFLRTATGRWQRGLAWVFLGLFGIASPWAQSVLQSSLFASAPENPYVYAHTHPDIYEVRDTVHGLVAAASTDAPVRVDVVWPGHDYWPLPWYLRDLRGVGYWDTVDVNRPAADIVLAPPQLATALQRQIYRNPRELYVGLWQQPHWLRNGVEIAGWARLGLVRAWRRLQESADAP